MKHFIGVSSGRALITIVVSSVKFLFLHSSKGAVSWLIVNLRASQSFHTCSGSFNLVVNCTAFASVCASFQNCLSHVYTCTGARAFTLAWWHQGENIHLSFWNQKHFQFIPTSENLHSFSSVIVETFELLKIAMLPSWVQAIPKSV